MYWSFLVLIPLASKALQLCFYELHFILWIVDFDNDQRLNLMTLTQAQQSAAALLATNPNSAANSVNNTPRGSFMGGIVLLVARSILIHATFYDHSHFVASRWRARRFSRE